MPPHSRRTILREGAGLAGLLAAGSVAGCLNGALPGTNSEPDPSALSTVPATARGAFHADVYTLLADDAVRTSWNAWLAARAEMPDYEGPTSMSGQLDSVATTAGVDVRDLSTVTAFSDWGEAYEDLPGTTSAVLLDGAWDASAFIDAVEVEDGAYEATTYQGYTVYRADERYRQSWGVLDDGHFVGSRDPVVEDVIDVHRGAADAIDGPVEAAYGDTHAGPVRFASTVQGSWVPTETGGPNGTISLEPLQSTETVAGSVSRRGSTRIVRATFAAPDAATARDIADIFEGLLELARMNASDEVVTGLLADVQVARSDAAVTLSLSKTVAELESVASTLGERAAGRREPAPATPQVNFTFAYDRAAGTVTVTHEGGDNVAAPTLRVLGEGFADASGADMIEPGPWAGTISDGHVSAGDHVVVGVTPNYEIGVVWESPERDVSAMLGHDEGPET